ncbi:alkaline phosphatase family protein [Edaphobacter acidisoli]|uniref:alkaline phosphatase family protein n=1 Tax=Edaphobacter acidisoli TaxID=2040573 RepID=UPI00166813E4|nr:alkaline phosphatase family protein [Edaphobacter acidisoli]
MRKRGWVLVLVVVLASWSQVVWSQQADNGQRVVLVMTDGLRWQEVFRGADASLLTPKRYFDGRDVSELEKEFLAATPEERREKLMPFLWKTMVPSGQIYGDRDAGSDAFVTNGLNFSYPGYSETLTGHGDPRINSNDNVLNPNLTVLAWLNHQPGMEGKVAAFGAWDVIASAVNPEKCGCAVNAGYAPFTMEPMTPRLEFLNRMKAETPEVWEGEPFDAPEFYTAMEYIKAKKPRVVFVSLGETDEWAHQNNYGEYLIAAHRVDAYLKQLWDTLQAMPEYRGKTTMIFLPDHGRGSGPDDWTSHGQKIPDAKYIFMAFMGPETPALGNRMHVEAVTQSQVAATLAKILGYDWNAVEPKAGLPVGAAVR